MTDIESLALTLCYLLCRLGRRGIVPDRRRKFQSYKADKHATRYVSSVTFLPELLIVIADILLWCD